MRESIKILAVSVCSGHRRRNAGHIMRYCIGVFAVCKKENARTVIFVLAFSLKGYYRLSGSLYANVHRIKREMRTFVRPLKGGGPPQAVVGCC